MQKLQTRRDFTNWALFWTGALLCRHGSAQDHSLTAHQFSVPLVGPSGVVDSRYNASSNHFFLDLGAGVSMDIACIPGGTFAMGSRDLSHREEGPVHIRYIESFGIGINPVTIGQWRRVSSFPKVSVDLRPVLRGSLPAEIEDTLPIDFVSWAQSVEFCDRLKAFSGLPFRIPSEAEWEYSCRAGTITSYHFGDGISLTVANYDDGAPGPYRLRQSARRRPRIDSA